MGKVECTLGRKPQQQQHDLLVVEEGYFKNQHDGG